MRHVELLTRKAWNVGLGTHTGEAKKSQVKFLQDILYSVSEVAPN
jgi:hypothetical protein